MNYVIASFGSSFMLFMHWNLKHAFWPAQFALVMLNGNRKIGNRLWKLELVLKMSNRLSKRFVGVGIFECKQTVIAMAITR